MKKNIKLKDYIKWGSMSKKKKLTIILSGVALLFAFISLIIGIIFVVQANGLVKDQMNNYNVNKHTIMWISELGKPFFGSSDGLITLVIIGIVLSIATIITIISMWIIIYYRKNKKNISFGGTKTTIAIPTVSSVVAIIGMSVLSVATNGFETEVDTNKVSSYFEQNALKISQDREKAAKAGLLYVLANKDNLAAFSKASTLQMTLGLTVFTTLKQEIANGNKHIIQELKIFSKNNPKLYYPVKGKVRGDLIKASSPKSIAEVWINAFPGYKKLYNDKNIKNNYAANILENHNAFMELTSGKYPEIFNRIKKAYDNSEELSYDSIVASDDKTMKILVKEGLFDIAGNSLQKGNLEWFNNLGNKSLKFEKRVLGTITKLFKLPYATKQDQFKSRITILEWLNTIINGIDYISKNEQLEVYEQFQNISGNFIAKTPKDIYMPTSKPNGTFEIIPTEDKKIGEVGENTYDIKFSMMQYILNNLSKPKNGIIEDLAARQKNINPISFIENILNSKGLGKMTDQYPAENGYFNDDNEYSNEDEINNIVNKINNFIK